MLDKETIETFMARKKHLKFSKEDVFEILKVVSVYENVRSGWLWGASGILGRGIFDFAKELIEADGESKVVLRFEGGHPQAERGRIVFFYPEGEKDNGSGLCMLEFCLSAPVAHRDVLGALLALGLKRSTIGDIITVDSSAYAYVLDEMADFIRLHAAQIGKANVKAVWDHSREDGAAIFGLKFKAAEIVAASARVDLILSKVYGEGRKTVKRDIERDRVKLNDFILGNAHLGLEEGDRVSYRGHGKIVVGRVKATTKKGNIVLEIKKYA